MSSSLLGYPLRKAAQAEMLSGGTRLSYLTAVPNAVKYTKSENIELVTPREEREDMQLEYQHIGQRLIPINISQRIRAEVDIIRSKDVYARFLAKERGPKFHPRAKDLSILPPENPVARGTGGEVFGVGKRFMPYQMMKPVNSKWAPALRGGGARSTRGQLHQERLDGKGFGWKRKARSLWQQDVDTAGFRPARYY